MRDMDPERTAFYTLIDMGLLPADALLSPTHMKENYYTQALERAFNCSAGDLAAGGCQGDVQKVPIQCLAASEEGEATNWIVDLFCPRGA